VKNKNVLVRRQKQELNLKTDEKIGGYKQIETRNFTGITSTHEHTDRGTKSKWCKTHRTNEI
jgi:hypothetical protein